MTESGCSGFEESWPWTHDDSTSPQPETQPEWTETEWHGPSTNGADGTWTGSAPVKVESDYKLAGVPVYAWIILFTAIIVATCVAFFFFA
jgi:hypothetical protein